MIRRGMAIALAVGGVVMVAGLIYLLRPDHPGIETVTQVPHTHDRPEEAMVPWRDPTRNTADFFPGATTPNTSAPRIVALSRHRLEIIQRLGPDTPLNSNVLYAYDVPGRGVVLIRRAAGEFGAIEIVVAQDNTGHVVGVHIQRHREPPEVAAFITAPTFLNAFHGKNTSAPLTLGKDLPKPPTVAEKSALAVSRAVRALLIEYDMGTKGRQ